MWQFSKRIRSKPSAITIERSSTFKLIPWTFLVSPSEQWSGGESKLLKCHYPKKIYKFGLFGIAKCDPCNSWFSTRTPEPLCTHMYFPFNHNFFRSWRWFKLQVEKRKLLSTWRRYSESDRVETGCCGYTLCSKVTLPASVSVVPTYIYPLFLYVYTTSTFHIHILDTGYMVFLMTNTILVWIALKLFGWQWSCGRKIDYTFPNLFPTFILLEVRSLHSISFMFTKVFSICLAFVLYFVRRQWRYIRTMRRVCAVWCTIVCFPFSHFSVWILHLQFLRIRCLHHRAQHASLLSTKF